MLVLTGAAGPVDITGNLSGSLIADSTLTSLAVGANISGPVSVTGDLGSLTVGGPSAGSGQAT